jgi:tRNA A-37 threonylcarbamoyl transferase component Bud32/tetratricopeptide (TPR) repeat protein
LRAPYSISIERLGFLGDNCNMIEEINPLATAPLHADDVPERSMGFGDSVAPTSRDSRPSIEQRYEIETTLAGLGLEDDEVGVPIGLHDRYVLRKLIGRGAMGAVFLADDVELQRRVAIKVVARRVGHERQGLRLRREARALAALDHPNVLKVFDLGNDGEELFIAMEHVAGKTLRAWQKDRHLDELLDVYLQAGRGLAAAHARGLVHRDFKPDNVLVDEAEQGRLRVRVGDFGLVGGDVGAPAPATEPMAIRGLLTSSNALLGTLPYMAPEQLRREPADARSDQHQFCVALWEAVAGERPFGPRGRPLADETSVPARPAKIPIWVYPVLRRGLAFAREDRYPSMGSLLSALERARRRRRARRWAAVGGLVAAMVGAAWWMQPEQPGPCQGTDEPMATIWTPDVRTELAASFEARGAGGMSQYVVGGLDRATGRWSQENQQLCEARVQASPSEPPELEDRQRCLEQWARQIEQRIERLRQPEGSDMTYAFALVTALEHVGESCVIPPLPIEPEVTSVIERAEQAELLRNLDDALRFSNEAVEVARQHGNPCEGDDPEEPLRSSELAAALFRLGHVQSERKDSKAALETLTEAHLHAYACADEHRDAEVRILAAKVRAIDLQDVEAARVELEQARVALRRVKEPAVSLRRYDERMATGLVDEYAKDFADARRHAEEALAALGDTPDPVLQAKLELNIGVAFQREKRYAEAAEVMGRASTRVARVLGEQHPLTRLYAARQALNLGLAAASAGDHATMHRYFEQAAQLDDPSLVIKALTAKAQAEFVAEDQESAKVTATALVTFLDAQPSLAPVTRATVETTAGQILAFLEDPKGLTVLEGACTRWIELDQREQAAKCELSLAQALHAAGRTSEARSKLDHVRSLETDPQGPIPAAIEETDRYLSTQPGSPVSP